MVSLVSKKIGFKKTKILYVSNFSFFDFALEHAKSFSSEIHLVFLIFPNQKFEFERTINDLDLANKINFSPLFLTDNFCLNVLKVLRCIREYRFKLLHLDGISGILLAPIIFFRKRVLINLHDVIPHFGENIFFNIFKNFFLKYIVNWVVLFSRQSETDFKQLFPRKNYFLTHLPIYCEVFNQPSKKTFINSDSNYLLYFGRISPYKGVEKLIEDFTSIDFSINLIIAGKANYDVSFPFHPRIHYHLNRLTYAELKYLIQNSAGIVIPYLEATQSGVLSSILAFDVKVLIRDIPAFDAFKSTPNLFYYSNNLEADDIENLLNSDIIYNSYAVKMNNLYRENFQLIYKMFDVDKEC